MLKKTSSRSGLFLLELIISILFFSMASAVCIRLFVQAHIMDRDNRNLTQSVKLCENLAEVYTASGGDLNTLTDIYPYLQRDYRSIQICLFRDVASFYRLEESTVGRIILPLHYSSSDESEPVTVDTDDLPYPGYAIESALTYTVQDMMMFLDKDWQPTLIPQSGGYVLCAIFFEEPRSAGTLRDAAFGVWEYDTMREIEVGELEALTGIVTDDYFYQFSKLSEEDAIYLLDVTVYVPETGGADE
ncbi:MAG: hypothetical protein HDQ98_09435 [Lachnospiraceae bacterium]|nr:hypothetical protein [Lachnospiraceae bacterium]